MYFMGMEVFLQKEPEIPGAAISGPRIAGEKFYGHGAFPTIRCGRKK